MKLKLGEYYKMTYQNVIFTFRVIEYNKVPDTYKCRICGSDEELVLYNLTDKDLKTKENIPCPCYDTSYSEKDKIMLYVEMIDKKK